MNNQLIKKEDLSIFDRIKNFFAKIFNKKRVENLPKKISISDNKNNEFEKRIKVKTMNKENELEDFIKKIEENPSIIENLSNDRLDQLINHYENIINIKKEKIQRLKNM